MINNVHIHITKNRKKEKRITMIPFTFLSHQKMVLPQKRLLARRKSTSEANPSSISFAYADTTNITCLNKRSPFECVICLTQYNINVPHGTDRCRHKLCRGCIRLYFNNALNEKHYKSFERVKCPVLGCKESFITDKVLINFFTKAEIKRWWNSAIVNAYMINEVINKK